MDNEHGGQGESLVPLYTRESVSLSLALSLDIGRAACFERLQVSIMQTTSTQPWWSGAS
jgi:hypothetical protein